MILSLPNLKELRVGECDAVPEGPLPTYSVTPQSGPLDSLELYGCVDRIGETLAKLRSTSRCLSMVRGLCGLSGRPERIMTDLTDPSASGVPPPIHLPPLPALTTLVIGLCLDDPLPRLTNILRSIRSAPALASIVLENSNWIFIENFPSVGLWVDVDRWLSRIAKHTKVTGGLFLTLRRWPAGRPVWEGFLPEFRESGGKIKLDDSW